MKEYVQTVAVFAVMLCLIPCLVFLSKDEDSARASAGTNLGVKIYFTKERKAKEFTEEDYMIGAVLAQMPADFEDEALKAQAVLARTYILYRRQSEETAPTPELNGCLISDDSELYQGFFTQEQAKEFYGEDYDNAYKKVSSAVKSVSNLSLTYKGKPVIAAFHAVSSGFTESALNAWGQDIPYLQSVESKSDKDIEGMESEKIYTAEELKAALEKAKLPIEFTDLSSAENWINIKKQTERGYVTSLEVCGTEVSVTDFTAALDIASPCFKCEFANTKFTFTAKGYGHLVGMSQYGANSMAREGKSFKDILLHYYTDCKITK